MKRNQRLVLVIEDGEHLITGDGRERSSQVATLLNLSDGLLGEYLGIQILLTVNCPIDQIDPALRRRGRLMAHHRFDPLPAKQAIALASHHGFSLPPEENQTWTLGDIFYHQDAPPPRPQRTRRVGFAPDDDDLPF